MAEQSGSAGSLPNGIRERGHNWWQLQDHYVTIVHPQRHQWSTVVRCATCGGVLLPGRRRILARAMINSRLPSVAGLVSPQGLWITVWLQCTCYHQSSRISLPVSPQSPESLTNISIHICGSHYVINPPLLCTSVQCEQQCTKILKRVKSFEAVSGRLLLQTLMSPVVNGRGMNRALLCVKPCETLHTHFHVHFAADSHPWLRWLQQTYQGLRCCQVSLFHWKADQCESKSADCTIWHPLFDRAIE